MRDRIIEIINGYEGAIPDTDTRAIIMADINEAVFGNIPVMTDISTPEEIDNYILTYAVEYPSGMKAMIKINTSTKEVQF